MTDKWCETDAPWLSDDEEKKEAFYEDLLGKVSILDILDKYSLSYTKCSGKFTHKLKCPLPEHLGGQENTASFFISEEDNFFFCFGCSARGNVIEFVSLYLGVPRFRALEMLYDISKSVKDFIPVKRFKSVAEEYTIGFYMFKASEFLRKFLKEKEPNPNYKKWKKWVDERFRRMDCFMDQTADEDWATAKKYYEKIVRFAETHNID